MYLAGVFHQGRLTPHVNTGQECIALRWSLSFVVDAREGTGVECRTEWCVQRSHAESRIEVKIGARLMGFLLVKGSLVRTERAT